MGDHQSGAPEPADDPPSPEPPWTRKDWITAAISGLALLVSATTMYFNVVNQNQVLSAIVPTYPFVTRSAPNTQMLVVHGKEFEVVFINSGKRTAAILSLEFVVNEIREDETSACIPLRAYNSVRFDTDFQAISLKDKDVLIKRVAIKPSALGQKVEDQDGQFRFPRKGQEPRTFVSVCVSVALATPTNARHLSDIPLLVRETVDPPAAQKLPPAYKDIHPGKPTIIFQESGTIFSN